MRHLPINGTTQDGKESNEDAQRASNDEAQRALDEENDNEYASEQRAGRETRDSRSALQKGSLPSEPAFTSTSAAKTWDRERLGELRADTAPQKLYCRSEIRAKMYVRKKETRRNT